MLNPGWRAKVMKIRPEVAGLDLLLCPKCKRPLAESNGTVLLKKCQSCGRWVLMKKRVDKTT